MPLVLECSCATMDDNLGDAMATEGALGAILSVLTGAGLDEHIAPNIVVRSQCKQAAQATQAAGAVAGGTLALTQGLGFSVPLAFGVAAVAVVGGQRVIERVSRDIAFRKMFGGKYYLSQPVSKPRL
jgi:hypothetical protein